ncbi:hypothetical protein [Mesorhizobium sp. KR1-2]|uniref:hypothetical protein n=1 Tax=Mesorhizobium sp. KR1-2 TaxID=3156609 RepID=UPI0032B5FDE9
MLRLFKNRNRPPVTLTISIHPNLAESEATDSMLDGLFDWKDGKTSKIYTAKKLQAKLARLRFCALIG